MKKSVFSIIVFWGICNSSFAQGKYAGNFKKLIGNTFSNEQTVPDLKIYQYHEENLISDSEDPQQMFLNVYAKKKSAVVMFSIKEDSSAREYHIVDVIEIKNIPKGWKVNTTTCKEGETEGQIIVALVKTTKAEYAGTVKKAWLCDRDKIRFEAVDTKLIKCLNEDGD